MSAATRKKKQTAHVRQTRRREAFRRLVGTPKPEEKVETRVAKRGRPYDERDLRGAQRLADLRRRLKDLTEESEDSLSAIETDARSMGFDDFAWKVAELRLREEEVQRNEASAKLDEAARKRKENDAWARRRRPRRVRQRAAIHDPTPTSREHRSNWPWRSVKSKGKWQPSFYILQRSWEHLRNRLPTLTKTKTWHDLSNEEREKATLVINAELDRRGVTDRKRR